MANLKQNVPFAISFVATVCFAIALAADGWSMHTSNGVTNAMGLWKMTTSGGGQPDTEVWIDATCNYEFAGGQKIKLPGCPEFEATRACAIIALICSFVAMLTIAASVCMASKCGLAVSWLFNFLAFALGLISWSLWIDWALNENNGSSSDFSYSFALSIIATALALISQIVHHCYSRSCVSNPSSNPTPAP